MKFTVGEPVGGPATYTSAETADSPVAAELLGLDGVTSVFMTADFVTVTKAATAEWSTLAPAAGEILGRHFG